VKVLCIDQGGDALDFCLRAKNAGHEVKHWMRRMRETEYIGRGLVERVDTWQDFMYWADLVFLADNTLWMDQLELYRAKGYPIFGPNLAGAELELDREAGQKRLKAEGIPILDYKSFTSYDTAVAYVKREMKPFVSKPNANADKGLSYVAKEPEHLVYMLERWKRLGKDQKEFILQEYMPGCEMAVGGFFGPHGFSKGWCENFEFKKFMDGDVGLNTGEQGTVMRFCSRSRLADAVLKPLQGWLEKIKYTGYIDVNCIIDEAGNPWPLEFTARPGWPTFNFQQALLVGDPAEWMAETLQGSDPRCWEMDKIALGVVMTMPDYPFSHLTRKEVIGVPIYGITPAIAPSIHALHVMAGKAPAKVNGSILQVPSYVTAGDYVLAVSGTGDTVLAARKQAYRVLRRLRLPNSPQYRSDIGLKLRKELAKCQQHGFAAGMEWDSQSA
jgi:phosphoribosylamine--glycine ligase